MTAVVALAALSPSVWRLGAEGADGAEGTDAAGGAGGPEDEAWVATLRRIALRPAPQHQAAPDPGHRPVRRFGRGADPATVTALPRFDATELPDLAA